MATLLVATMMTSMVFTSCDKDDDEFNHDIVGTWMSDNSHGVKLTLDNNKSGILMITTGEMESGYKFEYSVDDAKKELNIKLLKTLMGDNELPLFGVDTEYTVGFKLEGDKLTFLEDESLTIGMVSIDGAFTRQ